MSILKSRITLGISIATLALLSGAALGQSAFTSSGSNTFLSSGSVPAGTYYDYNDEANWSAGVPNLNNTTQTAIISNGGTVGYFADPHGDFVISGGATLQITNGQWSQVTGNSWMQLGQGGGGFGNILVNGGTFNQGTDGNSPFSITGTGNTFTITSGVANFSTLFAVAGITYNISGGSVNLTSNLQLEQGSIWNQSGGIVTIVGAHEFQFNSTSGGNIMSGGTLNITNLITGVNGSVGSTFSFSGGVINDFEGTNNGYYGSGSAHPFDFTPGSTGVFNFSGTNTTLSQVMGFVTSGGFTYGGSVDTTGTNYFQYIQTGSGTPNYNIALELTSVPEPSTYPLIGFGCLGMWFFIRRKKARILS